MIELNPLESARFGVIAAHIRDTTIELQELLALAAAHRVQFLSSRIPVSDPRLVHRYESEGFRLMDTIVHFRRELTNPKIDRALSDDMIIRDGARSDARAVAAVAKTAFSNYIGRYHADPNIDSKLADEAYEDWAMRTAETCSDSSPLMVSERGSDLIAFLALRAESSTNMEIVLNAVKPSAQGQGVYRRLLLAALEKSSALGFSTVSISTQIQNYSVQRIWGRLGFEHFQSYYTLHKWF